MHFLIFMQQIKTFTCILYNYAFKRTKDFMVYLIQFLFTLIDVDSIETRRADSMTKNTSLSPSGWEG